MSIRRFARERLRPSLRPLVRHEVDQAVRSSPRIAAKVLPIADVDGRVLVPLADPAAETGEDGFALPPPELWEVGSGALDRGAEHVAAMVDVLGTHGAPEATWGDVLDFGCGSGRMIRFLADHARAQQVWGVDVNEASIGWCRAHLSPPFRFSTCSSQPHLPFDGATFGLVYAGSVFTHISELADAWFLELRRVLRPGGHLYVTVQDQAFVAAMRDLPPEHATGTTHASVRDAGEWLDRLGADLATVVLDRGSKDAMVFHDRATLLETWSRAMEVVAVRDRAYDLQTAVVLRKPA
jgi:SAM-dependent methyltransferase